MTSEGTTTGLAAETRADLERRGVHLVNARGVPGSAGELIIDRDGRRALLTTHHLAFGHGAGEGDVLWAGLARLGTPLERCGRALRGRIGLVRNHDRPVFVDCALVSLDPQPNRSNALREAIAALPAHRAAARAAPGMPVAKLGAATGWTEGVVVDPAHFDRPLLDGRSHEAPGQVLVAPGRNGELFSAPGDSGAALFDQGGRTVGLLWGCTAGGEGIACPIAPVLACLGLEREQA